MSGKDGSPFLEGRFVTRTEGVLARALEGPPQLRDSAGISPDFAPMRG